MAFGFGKDKNAPQPGTAQPAQQPATQMSPEAMAMLAQMAHGGQPTGAAGQAPAAQIPQSQSPAQAASPMAPTMPPQGMGMGMPDASASGLPQMPGMPQLPVSPAANPSLSKKERRQIEREQKKAAAASRKEEKELAKRRRKGTKSRFSRAKYMREAQGNAAAGLTLSTMLLLITIFGPIIVNSMVLLPQTRQNQEVVQQVESYRQIIERSQPALQGAVNNKTAREAAIQGRLNSFRDGESVAGQLRQFISELEANGAEITSEASRTITNTGVGVSGLVGKTLSLEMTADFLTYLRLRNKFVRSQQSVTVSGESIVASPGNPIVAVTVTIMIPAKG